jgi:translation initiation factor IF-2
MPVRIYDIAKKVGLPSKDVLAKAKELGISTARVASSTIDKITADYLLEQLGYKPQPAAPAEAPEEVEGVPSPTPAPPEPVPAGEITAPAPAQISPAPPAEAGAPPSPETVSAPAARALAPAPGDAAPPAAAPAAPAAPPPTPAPAPSPALTEPAVAPTPVAPAAPAAPVPEPPPAAEAPSVAAPPAVSAAPTVSTPPATPEPAAPSAPQPAAVPAAPPPPPPPPPEPPKPRIGEKVGFIDLSNLSLRSRAPERADRAGAKPPAKAPAGRTEPARGRDARPATPAGRAVTPGAKTAGGAAAAGRSPARPAPIEAPTGEEIVLRPPIVVRELAEKMGKKPFQVIADLMEMGIFATVNQAIDTEVAQRVAAKHNFRLRAERRKEGGGIHAPVRREQPTEPEDRPEQLKPRAPVVTIMGHVDHGKTTLLDVIRKSDVAAHEAGGITQHIGAYTISVPHPERPGELQQITFLDTPGHAAFSAMRARGANVTDIVVLVVAANDGVMPQTLEALSHAQAAKVPIIVAVNKCDHPNANPLRVRQQLQERGVVPDDWGGDNIFVDCSALTRQGVDKLLEAIVLQAELLELKANPDRPARGNVIESGLDPGGPTATVLVRNGTLRVGDMMVCGEHYGRVRALINEENKRLKEAGPSVAVKVLGLNGVPEAGIEFQVVESERVAREICEERRLAAAREREQEPRPARTLEGLLQQLANEEAKVLRVVIKADTQGSVEAIVDALKKIESDKVSLEILHSAVGTISETDVVLAHASKAVILGFHTRVDSNAAEHAKRVGVQIKLYAIIYELIDQVKEAMAGLLEPELKEVVVGSAEVRQIFQLSKGGKVAGCVVTTGRIARGKARVVRRRHTIYEGLIQTLRRFQDEVNEVRAGLECGVRLDGFDDFEVGDLIECYTIEKVPQKL